MNFHQKRTLSFPAKIMGNNVLSRQDERKFDNIEAIFPMDRTIFSLPSCVRVVTQEFSDDAFPPVADGQFDDAPEGEFEDAPEDDSAKYFQIQQPVKLINKPLAPLAPSTERTKTALDAFATIATSVSTPSKSKSSPPGFVPIFEVKENDVLSGRGAFTNHHTGNIQFRQMVRESQPICLRSTKREKREIAKEIVDTIRNMNPPGRFLKRDNQNSDMWHDIGDRKAREKTSQALREGAPDIREGMLETAVNSSVYGGRPVTPPATVEADLSSSNVSGLKRKLVPDICDSSYHDPQSRFAKSRTTEPEDKNR